MVELIAVMVIVGVLASIGIPRLVGDNTWAAATFGEDVVSALRRAQHAAVSHRRVVCAQVGVREVVLRIAPDPGTFGCTQPLGDADADSYSTDNSNIAILAPSDGATLFFSPDGTIRTRTDASAPMTAQLQIQADGKVLRTINVHGGTGYVE